MLEIPFAAGSCLQLRGDVYECIDKWVRPEMDRIAEWCAPLQMLETDVASLLPRLLSVPDLLQIQHMTQVLNPLPQARHTQALEIEVSMAVSIGQGAARAEGPGRRFPEEVAAAGAPAAQCDFLLVFLALGMQQAGQSTAASARSSRAEQILAMQLRLDGSAMTSVTPVGLAAASLPRDLRHGSDPQMAPSTAATAGTAQQAGPSTAAMVQDTSTAQVPAMQLNLDGVALGHADKDMQAAIVQLQHANLPFLQAARPTAILAPDLPGKVVLYVVCSPFRHSTCRKAAGCLQGTLLLDANGAVRLERGLQDLQPLKKHAGCRKKWTS
eukprot:1146366-Pelagomonas_calceolata.AAC.3